MGETAWQNYPLSPGIFPFAQDALFLVVSCVVKEWNRLIYLSEVYPVLAFACLENAFFSQGEHLKAEGISGGMAKNCYGMFGIAVS